MCEFKYCRGTGTCFLSKTSPCAGFKSKDDETQKRGRVNSVRVSYPGFLDHGELMDMLDMADQPPMSGTEEKRSLFGKAPRFLRKTAEAV